ncbi:MAG: replication/maintenance protein RepL, partial [Candidatus Ratteibacteria bacterium]
ETGEIITDVFLLGKKPKYVDKGFVKIFVGFLYDLVEDQEVMGGPVRLLLYMVEKMDFNKLTVVINPKDVIRDLEITEQTYHKWKKVLLKKEYIKRINPYVYEIKPFSFSKGNMKKTIERETEIADKIKKQKEKKERKKKEEEE